MHLALLFRNREPSRTWDRQSPNIQLYAKHSTVLWTPLISASIPRPQRTQRFLLKSLIFHLILPKPPRPQTQLSRPNGGTGERRRSTCSPHTPLRGRLTLTCFAREKFVEDMITLFWGLRFRYIDPLQGKAHAAPLIRMCRNHGGIAVVPV